MKQYIYLYATKQFCSRLQQRHMASDMIIEEQDLYHICWLGDGCCSMQNLSNLYYECLARKTRLPLSFVHGCPAQQLGCKSDRLELSFHHSPFTLILQFSFRISSIWLRWQNCKWWSLVSGISLRGELEAKFGICHPSSEFRKIGSTTTFLAVSFGGARE